MVRGRSRVVTGKSGVAGVSVAIEQLLADPLQPSGETRVKAAVIDLQDETTDDPGIHDSLKLEIAARRALEEGIDAFLYSWQRSRQSEPSETDPLSAVEASDEGRQEEPAIPYASVPHQKAQEAPQLRRHRFSIEGGLEKGELPGGREGLPVSDELPEVRQGIKGGQELFDLTQDSLPIASLVEELDQGRGIARC